MGAQSYHSRACTQILLVASCSEQVAPSTVLRAACSEQIREKAAGDCGLFRTLACTSGANPPRLDGTRRATSSKDRAQQTFPLCDSPALARGKEDRMTITGARCAMVAAALAAILGGPRLAAQAQAPPHQSAPTI